MSVAAFALVQSESWRESVESVTELNVFCCGCCADFQEVSATSVWMSDAKRSGQGPAGGLEKLLQVLRICQFRQPRSVSLSHFLITSSYLPSIVDSDKNPELVQRKPLLFHFWFWSFCNDMTKLPKLVTLWNSEWKLPFSIELWSHVMLD